MTHLKHIEINIGKACNNKCRFCMSSNPELWDIKFIDFEKLRDKLINYAKGGYQSVGFLGGDVSIYPRLEELFSLCRELGFIEIHAITNGMLFADYTFAERIVRAGLTRVNISIHSHVATIEDYLTRVPNGFAKKIQAIQNFQKLYKAGLLQSQVSINIVLNQKNYTLIPETMLYFYKKMDIKDIRINFIWLDDMIRENWSDLKLSYTDFLPYLKQLIYISLKEDIRLTFDTIPPCIFYQVDPKNYKKLIQLFLGEEQDHITEIDWTNSNTSFNWQEKKKNILKTQFQQCAECSQKDRCQGVWKEYNELYGGSEFIPIP